MANATRVNITATVPLGTPVEVDVPLVVGTRKETVIEVEWVAEGIIIDNVLRTSVRGLGRGVYSVWCSFNEEDAPEWAPKPPAFLRDSVRQLTGF